MPDAADDEFRNPVRGFVRTFLWIAAIVLAIGILPLLIVSIARGEPASREGATIFMVISWPIALAMFVSAFASIFPARAADRALDAFRRGEAIARWELPPDLWANYAEGERLRWRRTATISVWIVFGTLAALGVFIGASVPQSTHDKIAVAAIAFAVLVALGLFFQVGMGMLVDRRAARLAGRPPRAYVAERAVYCGGVLNFWGSQMRALHACRVEPPDEPGEPSRLVFEIGMSRGGRSTMRAANVALAFAGRTAGANDQVTRQSIPIPPGQEDAAHKLAARLMAAE